MSPTRELPVETQAGGTEAKGRKATGLRSSSQDPLLQLVSDNPSSPSRGVQQVEEWLRQP